MMAALEDVERLSHIVRALLLLSQSETGQLVLAEDRARSGGHDPRPRGGIPDLRRGEAHPSLRPICPACVPMTADRIQIERLISNLLSNAMKYTPEGGWVHVRLNRSREL